MLMMMLIVVMVVVVVMTTKMMMVVIILFGGLTEQHCVQIIIRGEGEMQQTRANPCIKITTDI